MSDGDVAVGCKWCKLTVAVLGRADLPRGSPRYSLKWPILSCVGGVLLFAALLVRKSMSHCRAVRSMQAMCGNKTGGGGGSCVKREHGKVKTGQTGQTSQRARSTDRLIPTSNNPINRVCSCHRSPSTAKAVCLGCSPRIIQQAARTIHAVEVEMGKKMVWNPDPVLDFGTRPAKPRGSVESSKAKRYSRAAKSAKVPLEPVAVGSSPRRFRFPQASMHGISRRRIWGAAQAIPICILPALTSAEPAILCLSQTWAKKTLAWTAQSIPP